MYNHVSFYYRSDQNMHKENIQERVFVDKMRPAMAEYDQILQKDLSFGDLLKEMYGLIEKDKDFYGPYVVAAEILFSEGNSDEAAELLMQAYMAAVTRIADQEGNWPDQLAWEFEENRHILCIFQEYALLLWENDYFDEALELFRRILCMNPSDEQGIRYSMLALKMNLDICEWDTPFVTTDEHGCEVGIDEEKMESWFQENASQFSDEFQWLLDYYAQDEQD